MTMRKRILSMGEAVVDVLPAKNGLWRPVPGGSSYNVALALGRLGSPAAFVGRLSRDEQGRRMLVALEEGGVATDLVAGDERPSPLSVVERGSETRSARYSIHLADTAHAPPELPAGWLDNAGHLHVSSFSAVVGDWGRAVGAALDGAQGIATRSFDVNVRPNLLPARGAALELVMTRLRQVEFVKASEEDLRWLCPGEPPKEIARHWSSLGPLTILTHGGDGATAFIDGAPIRRPGCVVRVVDTVGAGDVFMAAFLARAVEFGCLTDLRGASAETISALLDFANAAAALCCSRVGADGPTRPEVENLLGASRSG